MSRKESREQNEERADGRLSDEALEQAEGGKRASEVDAPDKNKACFRMLEEDFLFKRLERRGWRR